MYSMAGVPSLMMLWGLVYSTLRESRGAKQDLSDHVLVGPSARYAGTASSMGRHALVPPDPCEGSHRSHYNVHSLRHRQHAKDSFSLPGTTIAALSSDFATVLIRGGHRAGSRCLLVRRLGCCHRRCRPANSSCALGVMVSGDRRISARIDPGRSRPADRRYHHGGPRRSGTPDHGRDANDKRSWLNSPGEAAPRRYLPSGLSAG